MMKYQLLLLLFLSFNLYSEEKSERNVNLSWIGYLNLPKKIVKEDSLIKVRKPKLWKAWSEEEFKINWVKKAKKDYSEEIQLYKILETSDDDKITSKRWKRNHQR